MKKKVQDELDKNEEYNRLIQLKEELNNQTYYISSRNVFPFVHGRYSYDIWSFSNAQNFVDEYDNLRDELVEKNKKAIFKRKTIKEIKYIDEKYVYCKKKLQILKKYEDIKKEFGDGDKLIDDIRYQTVRQILKENRNEAVVEDAFVASIRKDGDTGYVNKGAYDEIAYEIIDLEVTKMLKKTKYREKVDDLKAQFDEETEKEGENE